VSKVYHAREALILNQVTYRYPGITQTGVDLVSMELKKGEFVGVLGANGSGKSTLARLCSALLLPQSGEVVVGGLTSSNKENIDRIRQIVGLVFQDAECQFVANTVASEIAFGLENHGLPTGIIRERVRKIMEFFQLTPLAKTAPGFLSGGEKKKLALASVLVMRPEILLVDEPLTMLDQTNREEVSSYLWDLRRDGTALLWFSHSLDELLKADRVLILYAGKMVWQGRPEKILSMVEQAQKWGISLPIVSELTAELGLGALGIGKEEELVARLWK